MGIAGSRRSDPRARGDGHPARRPTGGDPARRLRRGGRYTHAQRHGAGLSPVARGGALHPLLPRAPRQRPGSLPGAHLLLRRDPPGSFSTFPLGLRYSPTGAPRGPAPPCHAPPPGFPVGHLARGLRARGRRGGSARRAVAAAEAREAGAVAPAPEFRGGRGARFYSPALRFPGGPRLVELLLLDGGSSAGAASWAARRGVAGAA